MTLAIPYRHNGEGVELRYSIRSMVMHFRDLTDVLLIGDRPDWYTGNHIEAAHLQLTKKRKEFQIFSKLILADGIVLYSADDIYALKPFGADMPQYYSRTCQDMKYRAADREYKKMYSRCPAHWHNFDIHHPMVIDTDKLRALDFTEDKPIKTLYANTYPGVQSLSSDCKIRGTKDSKHIKKAIHDRLFFSTHDNATPDMLAVLNQLYPLPCLYES